MGRRRTGRAIAGTVAGAALLLAGPAAGSVSAAGPTTFDGSCTLSHPRGVTDRPAGFLTQPEVTSTVTGDGSCTGRLDGTPVQSAPVSFRMVVTGRTSCLGSDVPLTGFATFALGSRTIRTRAGLTFRGLDFPLSLRGASGGIDVVAKGDVVRSVTDFPVLDGALACPLARTRGAVFQDLTLPTNGPLVSLD